MTVDFLHNKIVAETASESFKRCVNEKLVPLFERIYGSSLTNIQMYEDYIKDSFLKDGYWYYPMSIDLGVGNAVVWIKWDVSRTSDFEGGIPYAYVGEGDIEFSIADDVPLAFKNALVGRSHYFEGGYVKLNVTADAHGAAILAGRYSQTFVDELNRQISGAICRACGVKGLESSSIELNLVFAPGTYMEHTSENVTYRRMLITAKGCTPRDFWVKWTRLNSSVAYSVNDNVSASDIRFEIGEDVSHKIREKEYRFLVGGNADKYRVAMGRKNITEWRELIKRAIKRGELEKTTGELESKIHSSAVADKLSEVLEKCGFDLSQIVSATAQTTSTDAVDEALRAVAFGSESEADAQISITDNEINTTEAELELTENGGFENALDLSEDDLTDSQDTEMSEKDESDAEFSALTEWFTVAEAPSTESLDESDEHMKLEVAEEDSVEESLEDALKEALEESDGECVEEIIGEEIEELVSKVEDSAVTDAVLEESNDEEDLSDYLKDAIEHSEVTPTYTPDIIADLEEKIEQEKKLAAAEHAARMALDAMVSDMRADIDEKLESIAALEAKVGELTAEAKEAAEARDLALAELERMRAEYDKMTLENEKCRQAVKASEELRLAAEAARREQEKKLTEQLELQEKERTREKLLFAEAARQAKEENDRMASELAAAEAARRAEEEIALAARRREEEKARREAALAAEKERIENEVRRRMEQKEAIHESAISRALETIRKLEEKARINAENRITATSEYVTVMPENTSLSTDEEDSSLTDTVEAVEEENSALAESVSVDEEEIKAVVEEYTAQTIEETVASVEPVSNDDIKDEEFNSLYEDELPAPAYTPTQAYAPVQEPYRECTYMTKKARLIFLKTLDPNMLATVRDMLEEALTKFGKQNVFIKVRASIEDGNIMILNFVKIPDNEMQLLNDLLRYLGTGGIGITKILVE